MAQNVAKYIIGKAAGGFVNLLPVRDWDQTSSRVLTRLGAQTVADRYVAALVANGQSSSEAQASVYLPGNGIAPTLRVPASLLRDDSIGFRIARNGSAMTARIAIQKQRRSNEIKAASFVSKNAKALKKAGLVF